MAYLFFAVIKFCTAGKITSNGPKPAKKDPIVLPSAKSQHNLSSLDDSTWTKLLENIRGKNVSIEALLRAAKPLGFDGKNLNLGVYYQFHKDRLEDTKNTKILEDICKESLGLDHLKIVFELIEKPQRKDKPLIPQSPEDEVGLTPNADKDIIDVAEALFGK